MEIFYCTLYVVAVKQCCETALPEAPLILYYTVKNVSVNFLQGFAPLVYIRSSRSCIAFVDPRHTECNKTKKTFIA